MTLRSILKINASSRFADSVSRQLVEKLATRLIDENPGASAVNRDTAKDLSSISEDWVNANFTPVKARSAEQKAILQQSDELIAELFAADVLLIGLPIYNFGVPASFKAWIDLVCRAGVTFRYTDEGPQGLLTGKKAIVVVASGGVPVGSSMDHATGQVKQVLKFIGIEDVTFVSATGLATADPVQVFSDAEAEIAALSAA